MQNKRKQHAQGCVEMSYAITSDYRETILTVIAREYSAKRHAAKILAKHAKASYRTAEAWVAGRNVPSGAALMNIMAECEPMADAINRFVAERKKQRG